jgi:hypothetical protein
VRERRLVDVLGGGGYQSEGWALKEMSLGCEEDS